MRLKVIEDENLEEEVVLKIKKLDSSTLELKRQIERILVNNQNNSIIVYYGDRTMILDIHDILFFETYDKSVYAHTVNNAFPTKLRLYELEETLSDGFVRISKSCVVNLKQVSTIQKEFTGSAKIEFKNSLKITYVSRRYFKLLKLKLVRGI